MTPPVARRFPVFATLVVLAAIATMIGLGMWQLHRLAWKDALLDRYAHNQAMNSDVAWPQTAAERESALYRHTTVTCLSASPGLPSAGHNVAGETGWVQTANCRLPSGASADVVLGWTNDPNAKVAWSGGTVSGIIAPGAGDAIRLIAAPPPSGLQQTAAPDPSTIPNNHLSYAIQWFLFAATALVIYAIAVWKRMRG